MNGRAAGIAAFVIGLALSALALKRRGKGAISAAPGGAAPRPTIQD